MVAMSADTAPAAMPGVEEIARAMCKAQHCDPDFDYDPNGISDPPGAGVRWKLYIGQARAILDLFAPILERLERERDEARADADSAADGAKFQRQRRLEAEARALAAEAALAAERERCAKIAERFSDAALKCERCGDVRNTYAPGECSGERAYRETEEYQTNVAIHGAYAANRYFEKHLCQPREMDIAETITAIAAAIRAQGE